MTSLLALAGVADAAYLTFEHYRGDIPPCTIDGCETVLTSPYATLYGVPIALFGLLYYLAVLVLSRLEARWSTVAILGLTTVGLAISGYLVYLQLGVLNAVCLYCLTSAAITALLWFVTIVSLRQGGSHAHVR